MSGDWYDQHVHKYDVDRLAVLSLARETSLAQVAAHAKPRAILDIGCGTGLWLQAAAQQFSGATLHGLDPSKLMLDTAAARVKMGTICGDALDAEKHLAAESVDLVAMHFIFAYVSPQAALAQAHRLLARDGLLSVVTSTYESLARISEIGRTFIPPDADHLPLPGTVDQFLQMVADGGFEIVELQLLTRELEFQSYEEFYEFAVPGGWLVQHADVLGKLREVPGMTQQFFPLHDRFRGIAVLARRR